MVRRVSGTFALLMLIAGQAPAQQFPPGYVDPAPLLAALAQEIGEANLRCITYSGAGYDGGRRPDVRERREHRLAAHRFDGQLHAHHQLGHRNQHRDFRPSTRAESGLVEVRARLGWGHTDPDGHASDAHRQGRVCLAHGWRRTAGGGPARGLRRCTGWRCG